MQSHGDWGALWCCSWFQRCDFMASRSSPASKHSSFMGDISHEMEVWDSVLALRVVQAQAAPTGSLKSCSMWKTTGKEELHTWSEMQSATETTGNWSTKALFPALNVLCTRRAQQQGVTQPSSPVSHCHSLASTPCWALWSRFSILMHAATASVPVTPHSSYPQVLSVLPSVFPRSSQTKHCMTTGPEKQHRY